jgi:hypothetical protein
MKGIEKIRRAFNCIFTYGVYIRDWNETRQHSDKILQNYVNVRAETLAVRNKIFAPAF